MSETNYRNTKGKTNKDRRNNPTSHINHQQHFGNKPMVSNDIDELLSQRPSFTQLTMNDTPTRPHFGLGYNSHSTTATTTTQSLFTKRFVPASQNLAATDPSLHRQNGDGSSLSPESSENILAPTTAKSDTSITTNDNDSRLTRSTETNTNTNNKEQQDNNLKVEDNISQSNNHVPLGEINNTVSIPTDTQFSGTATDQNSTGIDGLETWQQHKWAAEPPKDDQQRYGNMHGMENYNGPYTYEYDDNYDDGDDSGRTNRFQQDDVDEDVFDFGLGDSDDDEYIQAYVAYQQHNYQTMMSHYHPGMYDQTQYNNQHYVPNSYQQNPKHRWYEDSPSGQLRRVDRRVQLFISDPSRETYQLPGMSMYCRRQVQGLATLYKLKMSHEDVGNNKTGPLLKKGPRTQLPADRRAIEKHINKIRTVEKAKKQMERRPGGAASEMLNRTRKEERRRLKGLPASDLTPPSVKKSKTRMVGSDAAPLASNNIGHRMMASMGWKEGDSLGVNNDGIANPIQPVIRTNRRGLGA